MTNSKPAAPPTNLFPFALSHQPFPMSFLILATLSGYLTYYLFAATLAPYGGQRLGPTSFLIHGPGPGWFLLVGWWLMAIALRTYSFLVWHTQELSVTRRYNNSALAMLGVLMILELVILIDLQDDFF
ncbi:MAG: hypothetical protein VKL39_00205 [Leptolyngbyaceae bacterium]|nr:hypothetical protein [Leptolyngbyaceae bacterium]